MIKKILSLLIVGVKSRYGLIPCRLFVWSMLSLEERAGGKQWIQVLWKVLEGVVSTKKMLSLSTANGSRGRLGCTEIGCNSVITRPINCRFLRR